MMDVLSTGTQRPRVTQIVGRSTLIVDGHALVMVLGRPSECNTFDNLGNKFLNAVLASGKEFHRIDVTFDKYRGTSIKCATRKNRSRGLVTHPFEELLKMAQYRSQSPGPTLVAPDENKADLALFLSDKLLAAAPWIRSSLLVMDSKRNIQSSVPARTLISESLSVSIKRRTLE